MRKTKVTIRNLQKKLPISPTTIKRIALEVLSREGIRSSAELTICFVGDAKIRQLNKKYLGIDAPTDVLAFDLSAKAGALCADILISAHTAVGNAKIFNTSPYYELYLYVVHGILHLIGYDDAGEKDRRVMQKKAELILETLPLPRCPYTRPRR